MTEQLPDAFSIEDVLSVLRDAYGCHERARIGDLIIVLCDDIRGSALTAEPGGVPARDLAGALAVLGIDFQEFLTRLAALRRGNGAESGQS